MKQTVRTAARPTPASALGGTRHARSTANRTGRAIAGKALVAAAGVFLGGCLLPERAVGAPEARADRLVAEVRSQGLLSVPVRVRAGNAGADERGLAAKLEDDFSCTVVLEALREGFIPPSRRSDPLVEEFALLHELAHCEHLQLAHLFRSTHASGRENCAYHDLVLLAPWSRAVALFKEMYADTYAAAALLFRHRFSREARALVRALAQWRHASAKRVFSVWRIHATAPALEALVAQVDQMAALPPEALRERALEIASDVFLASLPGHAYADEAELTREGHLARDRYVGWIWGAADGGSAERSFGHFLLVASRLCRPMDDLLLNVRRTLVRDPGHERVRSLVESVGTEVALRLGR